MVSFRVLHGLLHGLDASLNEVRGELVERGPHQVDVQVLGSGCVRSDKRQVYRGLGDCRQFDFGLLRGLEEALQRLRVIAQVDAVGLLEILGEIVDDPAVEVVAAQMGVTCGRQCTSTTPSPTVRMLTSNVPPPRSKTRTVSFSSLSMPYANAAAVGSLMIREDLQARDPSGVLGRLALCVIEVRRDGDHSFGDLFAEELTRVVHQFA